MNIPNPNTDAPYEKVIKDHDGTELFGIRKIDGLEEIVNLKTNASNMLYHKPQIVFNPENCSHVFTPLDIPRREVECSLCHMTTSFVLGQTTKKVDNNYFIEVNKHFYPLSL